MRFTYLTLVIVFVCLSLLVWAGPIPPSTELMSKTKTDSNVSLDLPYKISSPEDVQSAISEIETTASSSSDTKDPYAGKIVEPDFSKIPFIPSKGPDFQNLGDPELPE